VIAKDPLGDDYVKRTFLVEAPLTSISVVQVAAEIEPHIHKEHDEILYFLEAKGSFRLGREEFEVRQGDLVYVPAGIPHGGKIGRAKLLSVYAPYYNSRNPDRFLVRE